MEEFELILVVYEGQPIAAQQLRALQALERRKELRLFNAAIITKSASGVTSLKEVQDVDTSRGAIAGALAGALVGWLGGPVGAVVGALAGATTGGIAASRIDLGFSKSFLKEVRQALKPDSSLLVVMIENLWADKVVEELMKIPGRMFRHAVKDQVVKLLEESR